MYQTKLTGESLTAIKIFSGLCQWLRHIRKNQLLKRAKSFLLFLGAAALIALLRLDTDKGLINFYHPAIHTGSEAQMVNK